MTDRRTALNRCLAIAAAGLVAVAASGCGGSTPSGGGAADSQPGTGKRVLPVARNPISNTATAPGLMITKALVENNASPTSGKAVPDHLEIAMKNTGSKPIEQVAVYYRITDAAKGVSEGYYAKLDGFTIAPGATRVAHFDQTGAKDHYPVNKYSLYYTDKNALVVEVTASSPRFKPASFTVKKDSAGAEAGVE